MTAWYKHLKPHADVQVGKLDESVFAANLMEVADGKGRPVYTDANAFFEKTYLTEGLKSIGKRVVQALNGGADIENRVISLQTGFGGGKTHTLIALYHLAKLGKNVGDISSLQALVADTGIPNFEKANVAVFTNTTSNPTSGRVIGEQRVQTMCSGLRHHSRKRPAARSTKGLVQTSFAAMQPCADIGR
jgi:predicted AAA+ superfamily ATPase